MGYCTGICCTSASDVCIWLHTHTHTSIHTYTHTHTHTLLPLHNSPPQPCLRVSQELDEAWGSFTGDVGVPAPVHTKLARSRGTLVSATILFSISSYFLSPIFRLLLFSVSSSSLSPPYYSHHLSLTTTNIAHLLTYLFHNQFFS